MIVGGEGSGDVRARAVFQCRLLPEERRGPCLGLVASCDEQKDKTRYDACLMTAPRTASTFPLSAFWKIPPGPPLAAASCSENGYSAELVRQVLKDMLQHNEKNDTYYLSDPDTFAFEQIILLPFARCGRFREIKEGLARFYRDDLPPKHAIHAESEKNLYALWSLLKVLELSTSFPAGARFDRKAFYGRMDAVLFSTLKVRGKTERMELNKGQMGINFYLRLLVEGDKEIVRSKLALPDDALLQHLFAEGFRRPWITSVREKYR
ncbi:MAG: hypothetical protein HY465_04775 [Deltaproteobacteria bacterium]|nr:hypothetical protein [Deltaproteobacteria bacterium]